MIRAFLWINQSTVDENIMKNRTQIVVMNTCLTDDRMIS